MAMNKNWYAKKRLEEQLKFFGAKKTRFISRYAKKPRVRVNINPINDKETIDSCNYMVKSAVDRGNYISGLAGKSANIAYIAQMNALQNAAAAQLNSAHQSAVQQSMSGLGGMAANNVSALANLIGSTRY